MSDRIYHLPCLKDGCGSSDAVTYYVDKRNAYCYSCSGYYYPDEYPQENLITLNNKGKRKLSAKTELTKLSDTFQAIPERGIDESTAKLYGIRVSGDRHYYPFTRNGKHVANQIRNTAEKGFYFENFQEGLELFGQSAFPAGSAKQITIVEGAIDAASAYQLTGSRYPVVAVYSAGTAEKEVRANLDYLNKFEKIVICLDNDKPGQEATEKVARILPVGKVRTVKLQHGKDPNEYLMKKVINGSSAKDQFTREWFQGADWTPTGLRKGADMWEEILDVPAYAAIAYPWEALQKQTYGIQKEQLIIIHAPSGVGKSTILNEIEYKILQTDKEAKIGLLRLEESNRDSVLGLMSIHLEKRLHLPDVWQQQDETTLRKAYDEVINSDRVILYDHFGSTQIDDVLDRIRQMHAQGCDYIFLDHLSIVVSDQSGDERKQLDELATKIKTLCMELKIALIAVIHENRQGGIRGTAGVEQLANIVIQANREVKSKDDWRRNVITLQVNKNRFTGMTGPSSYLYFDQETGRLRELGQSDIAKYENELIEASV
jgi:twinkle protein